MPFALKFSLILSQSRILVESWLECQKMSSHSPCYLSGPNHVWSLGIILVNLTCGLASVEDSTIRAYFKEPKFLNTSLPLTPGLDSILRRIFECDPSRRIPNPRIEEFYFRMSKIYDQFRPQPALPYNGVSMYIMSFCASLLSCLSILERPLRKPVWSQWPRKRFDPQKLGLKNKIKIKSTE